MRALLAALILVWCGMAFASQPAKPSEQDDQPNTTKQPASNVPIPSQTDPSTTGETKRDSETNPEERRIANATDRLVIVTGILAFFTFLLWLATYLLGKDADTTAANQREDMQASITEAAKAAVAMEEMVKQIAISADAATRSVEGTAKFLKMAAQQARAYMKVDFGVVHWQEGDFLFGSEPALTNTGNTPARNVCHKVMCSVFEPNLPAPFAFDENADWKNSDTTIAPQQTVVTLNAQLLEGGLGHVEGAMGKILGIRVKCPEKKPKGEAGEEEKEFHASVQTSGGTMSRKWSSWNCSAGTGIPMAQAISASLQPRRVSSIRSASVIGQAALVRADEPQNPVAPGRGIRGSQVWQGKYRRGCGRGRKLPSRC